MKPPETLRKIFPHTWKPCWKRFMRCFFLSFFPSSHPQLIHYCWQTRIPVSTVHLYHPLMTYLMTQNSLGFIIRIIFRLQIIIGSVLHRESSLISWLWKFQVVFELLRFRIIDAFAYNQSRCMFDHFSLRFWSQFNGREGKFQLAGSSDQIWCFITVCIRNKMHSRNHLSCSSQRLAWNFMSCFICWIPVYPDITQRLLRYNTYGADDRW